MFCASCGTEVKNDDVFCANCGNEITSEKAYQATLVPQQKLADNAYPAGMQNYWNNGAVCQRCGSHNPALATFSEARSRGAGFVILAIFLVLLIGVGWVILLILLASPSPTQLVTMATCQHCGYRWRMY